MIQERILFIEVWGWEDREQTGPAPLVFQPRKFRVPRGPARIKFDLWLLSPVLFVLLECILEGIFLVLYSFLFCTVKMFTWFRNKTLTKTLWKDVHCKDSLPPLLLISYASFWCLFVEIQANLKILRFLFLTLSNTMYQGDLCISMQIKLSCLSYFTVRMNDSVFN